ncbi:unnamed protein product [Prorocentrum cordatum]|uniref:non-specific serine/threonine protein kinase n=1 Tax=Prorocentrum cordatum TaxID=2364126 RepID=A0ABN9SUA9_9DINO|nr:unnamed protein product [Polarella glacialis]
MAPLATGVVGRAPPPRVDGCGKAAEGGYAWPARSQAGMDEDMVGEIEVAEPSPAPKGQPPPAPGAAATPSVGPRRLQAPPRAPRRPEAAAAADGGGQLKQRARGPEQHQAAEPPVARAQRQPEPAAVQGQPSAGQPPKGDQRQPQPSKANSQKFQNFIKAVERGKGRVESEFDNRVRRNEVFQECASGCDGAQAKFKDLEQRALLAKMKSWTTSDFVAIRTLGQGSFGKVFLVRQAGVAVADPPLYALKQMKKEGYTKKNNVDRAFCEREVLAQAKSRWFVELIATFQDAANVYMVMEFVQGGDTCRFAGDATTGAPSSSLFSFSSSRRVSPSPRSTTPFWYWILNSSLPSLG